MHRTRDLIQTDGIRVMACYAHDVKFDEKYLWD
jgi:hypothetical protein